MDALLATELEELYDEIEDAQTEAEPENEEAASLALKERFRIKDLGGANWAFRKIRALRQRMEENKVLAETDKARIDAWLASQNTGTERNIAFFESLLTEYFLSERAKDGKFKLSTPYGKVSTRKTDKWDYNDEVLVKSLKAAGLVEFIKVEETPIKDNIKKAKNSFIVTDIGTLATADGEVIAGVTVTKAESISIKTE